MLFMPPVEVEEENKSLNDKEAIGAVNVEAFDGNDDMVGVVFSPLRSLPNEPLLLLLLFVLVLLLLPKASADEGASKVNPPPLDEDDGIHDNEVDDDAVMDAKVVNDEGVTN
jgi:hypothetical protein